MSILNEYTGIPTDIPSSRPVPTRTRDPGPDQVPARLAGPSRQELAVVVASLAPGERRWSLRKPKRSHGHGWVWLNFLVWTQHGALENGKSRKVDEDPRKPSCFDLAFRRDQ